VLGTVLSPGNWKFVDDFMTDFAPGERPFDSASRRDREDKCIGANYGGWDRVSLDSTLWVVFDGRVSGCRSSNQADAKSIFPGVNLI